jgi:hypothetical protein
MQFVIEIPDQLVPTAASGDIAVASPATNTFSGGPAQAAPDPAASPLAANSGGEADELAGGVAVSPGGVAIGPEPNGASDGGAGPNMG